jgi:hypothetical protein
MDIPGLDMLTSDPQAVIHSGWLTAALPGSAAQLIGGRRVMTEISDFAQKMSGRGPAGLADMQAAAAWQAAWGVTEFTLYYGPADRPAEAYRAYCEYVGRLNAILKTARFDRRVLLYYPIYDLWPEYLPVAGPLQVGSQSRRAQQIVDSFMRLGRTLQRSQIPFLLVDHENLARAEIQAGGRLRIGQDGFESLVLPDGVELPPQAASLAERFQAAGGRVLRDDSAGPLRSKEGLVAAIQPAFRISPASDSISLGGFSRDGRQILLLVNVGRESYTGHLLAGQPSAWLVLDPATAKTQKVAPDTGGQTAIQLAGGQSLILVSSP